MRLTEGQTGAERALIAFARCLGEIFLEFTGLAIMFLGVSGRFPLDGDVRPFLGIFGIDPQPFFQSGFGIGLDGFGRTLRFADTTINALIGVDHQHIVALIKAVHGADFNAIHVFAFDAVFGNDIGQDSAPGSGFRI